MRYRFIALVTLIMFSAAPIMASIDAPIGSAQAEFAQADRSGNFYRNEAPLKAASIAGRLAAGSLWRVVSAELNCRRAPGTAQPIVRQFRQGDILQAEVYWGGADEVLLNPKDETGKPWMPVRGEGAARGCYVRANSRYIQPMTEKQQ